ncbi:MAG TPA: 30S ribosomal protein S4 [Phycisphaerae bacterium]|nr:30S ribosomal protein S4 [Phycisphaerae bacterium]HQL72866.1 30S ribosomal protein S4 [Phycisphaerae bacterium]
MGRYTGPVCRLCRREGIMLMLKGARCETAKCPIQRQWRNFPPGQHNWRRGRGSEYRLRLREKQKVKRFYGIYEKQFMKYFRQAERQKGNTGAALLGLLERRLDNVVHKLGFAPSRASARQLISHGHVYVNARPVSVGSYMVRVGDKLTIKPAEKSQKRVRACLEELGEPHLQNWLKLDMSKLEAEVIAMPTRDDVTIPVEEQLIVELCSQ